MTQSPDRPDFFLEIEDCFGRLRGTAFVFSSRDWLLMKEWNEEGIPLAIVLEAMTSCFEKRKAQGRKRTISSLRFCRHAVRELWEERKDLYVGSEESVPETDPEVLLEQLSVELEARAEELGHPADERIAAAAAEIRSLARGRGVPEIEDALVALEETVLEQLAGTLEQAEREQLEAELEDQLAPLNNSDPKTLERTRSASWKRLLRKRFQLPRFTLF